MSTPSIENASESRAVCAQAAPAIGVLVVCWLLLFDVGCLLSVVCCLSFVVRCFELLFFVCCGFGFQVLGCRFSDLRFQVSRLDCMLQGARGRTPPFPPRGGRGGWGRRRRRWTTSPECRGLREDGKDTPGGNPGAILKSISHRCYLRQVAFEWGLT